MVIGADGMGISARLYPDIVRDTLTVLTSGIAGERCDVTIDTSAPRPIATALLRPSAKRVSSVSGLLSQPDGTLKPYTFGLDEYELIGEPGDPESLRIDPVPARTAPISPPPAPRSPSTTTHARPSRRRSPTSPSAASPARWSRRSATSWRCCRHRSRRPTTAAFVDTAAGSSLDRLVALLGYIRYRAGPSDRRGEVQPPRRLRRHRRHPCRHPGHRRRRHHPLRDNRDAHHAGRRVGRARCGCGPPPTPPRPCQSTRSSSCSGRSPGSTPSTTSWPTAAASGRRDRRRAAGAGQGRPAGRQQGHPGRHPRRSARPARRARRRRSRSCPTGCPASSGSR